MTFAGLEEFAELSNILATNWMFMGPTNILLVAKILAGSAMWVVIIAPGFMCAVRATFYLLGLARAEAAWRRFGGSRHFVETVKFQLTPAEHRSPRPGIAESRITCGKAGRDGGKQSRLKRRPSKQTAIGPQISNLWSDLASTTVWRPSVADSS